MRIVNLIENTEGRKGCEFAHGLSFYIETKTHRVLMDLGPSEKTIANARILGIERPRDDFVGDSGEGDSAKQVRVVDGVREIVRLCEMELCQIIFSRSKLIVGVLVPHIG